MSGVNKVIIVGRLGKDAKILYTTNGEAVANFSLATSETWKDKAGEKQEKTEWHNCVVYRKLAEVIGEYVHKGDQLYVEGKLQTHKWQTKEGQDRYSTEIIVEHFQMLGVKSSSAEQAEPEQQATPAKAPVKSPAKSAAKKAVPQQAGFDNFEDDIPF